MPATATTDSGPCAQCGTKNSTFATKCHSCGAVLPWVKQPKAPPQAEGNKVAGLPPALRGPLFAPL